MKIVYSLLLVLPLIAMADEQKLMSGHIETPKGNYAFGPYVNYDSTYSWTFGAAFIKESEDKAVDTFHLDLEGSSKGYLEVDTNYRKKISSNWNGALEFDYNTFFDPFYGRGISTHVEDKKLVDQREVATKANSFYEYSPELSFGPFIEFHSRRERPEKQVDKQRFNLNEQSASLGADLIYDTRDSKLDPNHGYNLEFTANIMPADLTNLDNQNTFTQLKMDLRKYFPVYKTVFASRVAAAKTLGTPSYLYTYRLGGANYMRGYEANRFIGNQFAVVQLEDRFKIYKEYLSGTISYEVGSVTSKLYDKRRSCKGVGLRVAMPPDWRDKLSVNFSYGDDQSNVEMEFNENF
ncbi:MAG: BamA/TamA family outer membrane protein [Bacteriovorax sp.]|nr:BamA/TamA family outer membrane protein [Bacteriovorax sp.]